MRRLPAVRILWLLPALTAGALFFCVSEAKAESDQPAEPKLAKAEAKSADEADAEETAPKVAQADVGAESDEPAASVSAEAPPAEKATDEDVGDETQGNAALAAGGVVVSGKGFPLGANLSLTNSFGSGNLLPGSKQQPNWTTDLWIGPTLSLPKLVDWQPNMVLAGGMGITVDLLSAYRPRPLAGPYERMPRLSDSSVRLLFPGLIKEPFTGITFTPSLAGVVPTSLFSRHQNRLLGLGAGIQASWSKSLGDIWSDIAFLGSIGAQWRTGLTGWLFSATSPTLACDDRARPSYFGGLMTPGGIGPDHPLIAPREEEYLEGDSGMCIIPGRQWFGSMANSGSAFWNFGDPTGGNHTFMLTYGITNIALRPLTDRADLRSPFAAPQSYFNTTDYSSGSVQYNYQLPVYSQVQVTAGISSFQPLYDDVGNLRFPWWDSTLGNQFTQGFVSVNYNL